MGNEKPRCLFLVPRALVAGLLLLCCFAGCFGVLPALPCVSIFLLSSMAFSSSFAVLFFFWLSFASLWALCFVVAILSKPAWFGGGKRKAGSPCRSLVGPLAALLAPFIQPPRAQFFCTGWAAVETPQCPSIFLWGVAWPLAVEGGHPRGLHVGHLENYPPTAPIECARQFASRVGLPVVMGCGSAVSCSWRRGFVSARCPFGAWTPNPFFPRCARCIASLPEIFVYHHFVSGDVSSSQFRQWVRRRPRSCMRRGLG